MKHDDPDLRRIEEWTGHRAASLIPTAAAILIVVFVVGFVAVAAIIASNLLAKP